jgi:hypothetical protein
MKPKTGALVALLLTACVLATSCKHGGDYKFDTVTFRVSEAGPPLGSAPNVHIDTNLTVSGMWGGTVRTSKPYSIGLDYADETFTFASAEVTRVTVTYADGTNDPGAAALALPLRFGSRATEITNSVAGGRVVKTKLRIISGKIPGAITRDLPFALRLEGKLIRDDDSSIPFAVECKYDVVTNTTTKPWGEVMQDK